MLVLHAGSMAFQALPVPGSPRPQSLPSHRGGRQNRCRLPRHHHRTCLCKGGLNHKALFPGRKGCGRDRGAQAALGSCPCLLFLRSPGLGLFWVYTCYLSFFKRLQIDTVSAQLAGTESGVCMSGQSDNEFQGSPGLGLICRMPATLPSSRACR